MSAMPKEATEAATAEEDRLPGRAIWVSGVVAAVVIVASVLVANAFLRADGGAGTLPHGTMPSPRAADQIGVVEQTLIRDTRRGLVERAEQDESLRHLGWLDREHGIARIPIDRAMDLAAEPAFVRRAFAADRVTDAGSDGAP